MARLPLPEGYKGSGQLPQTNQILQNCWKDKDGRIIQRPHISQLNTTGKVARGAFEWNGAQYQVVSESLIKITNTETGAFSTIGTIAGANPIEWAIGFNDAVIVVRGGSLYTLDDTDTLTDISGNTNFVPCVDVTHINGRFIYIPASGDPAFFSDIGAAGTVQAASFFDAERLPDKNNVCFALNDTLYIGGTDLFEPFRDTGASPNPFSRVDGGAIRAGFIGGLLESAETFYFIGRKTGHGAGIFAIGSGAAPQISNERIDLILAGYSNVQLAEAIPGRFIWRGQDVATFTLQNDSFAFVGGEWIILERLSNGISKPWGGGYITEFGGEYFTAFDDKIGKLGKINTDYGERTTKIIGMGVQQGDEGFITVLNMELGISQGFNATAGTVALRMSRDNVQFGPSQYLQLGAIGQYQNRLRWNPPGGLGNYETFFGYEIRTTADINFSADHLSGDIV